jgi:nucleotide-binding universal stress UspA family protein
LAAQPASEREHAIVVGVDGSVPSKAALAWAIKQARLTGAVVEAVIAWEFPLLDYGSPVAVVQDVDFEKIAAGALAAAIAEVAGPDEPVTIRSTVVRGNAARALLDASAAGELLVVGSRGRGGFVGALLGSVGQHCVHHATCPVVVIRDSVTPGRAGEHGDGTDDGRDCLA